MLMSTKASFLKNQAAEENNGYTQFIGPHTNTYIHTYIFTPTHTHMQHSNTSTYRHAHKYTIHTKYTPNVAK